MSESEISSLVSQQEYQKNSLSSKLGDTSLKYLPTPEYVVLHGLYKEVALGLVTGYHTQVTTKIVDEDEEIIETLEKLHYGCVNDTPVQKKHLLRAIPDFRMELNIPLNKIDKSKPVFMDLFKKIEKERNDKKHRRNKDHYDA